MKSLENVVKRYLKGGFEFEVFKQRIKKTKIEVSNEEVENLSSSEEVGVGIRVLKEGKIGFAYASGLEGDKIADAVERAMEICELQSPDSGNVFNQELKSSKVKSVFDREGLDVAVEDKIGMALELEKKAKNTDGRIKGVRKASITEGVLEVEVKNSYGVSFQYEGTYYTASVATLAQEGQDSAISWEFRGSRRLKDLDTEDMVRDVVFKTISLLNPKEVRTKVMPVVFFRESFAMLLEAFSSMFLGDSYVKRKTLLKDKVGESVGSELLTVIDDGSLENGFYTFPYDAEGVRTTKNTVIDRGVFKGFLHSLYTATLSEEEPTGNSQRGSYRSLPHSGITNLYVEPGDVSFDDLLGAEEEVFLVLDMMGLHTVDPVSGEFSLGASGVLMKGGKPAHAVRGVTVAGNVLDLWNKIVAVGNDLKFYGNLGSPSVLVKDITVGGS